MIDYQAFVFTIDYGLWTIDYGLITINCLIELSCLFNQHFNQLAH
jgi:hypothetical protein